MKLAPNKSLERTITRLHALTGSILVPAAQRQTLNHMMSIHDQILLVQAMRGGSDETTNIYRV
jgi:hypothetical protein